MGLRNYGKQWELSRCGLFMRVWLHRLWVWQALDQITRAVLADHWTSRVGIGGIRRRHRRIFQSLQSKGVGVPTHLVQRPQAKVAAPGEAQMRSAVCGNRSAGIRRLPNSTDEAVNQRTRTSWNFFPTAGSIERGDSERRFL